ncbi:uncharacterized protein LOC106880888 [Octopus bimaculoides]|uniref:Uncharacterized protein n=1 Tax=Octopus bimaculoides TaxID=37653 RepID=A0A0L8FVK1_OCTBM|nr:uncharacterized protein LOC106880888 [Octopus bimaculoides]|eukprot:XP_014786527.1 PREDICTED: uncharacterized protein LOC106880888 [Octopus bimaculoides]
MDMLQSAYGVQVFGFVADVVAIATVGWLRTYSSRIGLFKICSAFSCYQVEFSGKLSTMRGAVCLGFILLLISVIMASVYIFKQNVRGYKKYRWAVAIMVLLGGIFGFVGPLFGIGNYGFTPSYSLYIALLAGILSIVAGSLHIVAVKRTVFE